MNARLPDSFLLNGTIAQPLKRTSEVNTIGNHLKPRRCFMRATLDGCGLFASAIAKKGMFRGCNGHRGAFRTCLALTKSGDNGDL
jgi:hypothetical protein